jgi:cytochrome c-type biogenesis protein CcmH
MLFWIITAALTIIVAGSFVIAALRVSKIEPLPAAQSDIGVYRAQLAEVERDVARGVLPQAEADRTLLEIKRRILDASRSAKSAAQSHRAPRLAGWAGLIGGGALLAGAFGLYLKIGAPGYADQPMSARLANAQALYDSRPSQKIAEEAAKKNIAPPQVDPRLADLVAQLRVAVAENPDRIEGQELLAQNEETLGNLRAAWEAQARVIALKGADATSNDYLALADLKIVAAGGFVTEEGEEALLKALDLDPTNAPARYYAGLMMAQNGRPDETFKLWAPLIEEGPEAAPWIAPIRASINELAWLAGEPNYVAPPAPQENMANAASLENTLKGPDADAVAAASDMSDTDRNEMVRGMVSQLAGRLKAEGGSPEEWARLISSLGVLGESEAQEAALASAKSAFPDQADRFEQARKAAFIAPAPTETAQ